MDLKYLTKEGSWEKNPPDLQAEVLRGKRGRLLVTIYRAGGAGLHPTVLLSHDRAAKTGARGSGHRAA